MRPIRLVIFAKAPRPGQVKTRLIPALGAEQAAHLATRLLVHTLQEALKSKIRPVELCVTPAVTDPAWQTALTHLQAPGVIWNEQGEGELGERLTRAAARIDAQGEAMLFIGTDCPALDAAMLERAAQQLIEHNAVLIPSTDGGYVLLGLRRFHPAVFTGILWSSAIVTAQTRSRLAALGWRWVELPALTDIDEPQDLSALPAWLEPTDEPVTRLRRLVVHAPDRTHRGGIRSQHPRSFRGRAR
jgi:rSAM/selenodomain-associated transferase 1